MISVAGFFLKILKISLPLGLVFLVGYLVVKDLNVDGERVVLHSAENQSLLVEGPNPDTRVAGIESDEGDKFWVVTIDPVYWQLKLPRRYQTVGVEIIFQAQSVPIVQLGGLASQKGWNFYWQGMQNDIFERIDWPCLVDSDRSWYFCQRVKNYQSIDRFLLAPPGGRRILNYNFPLDENFAGLDVVGYNSEIDYHDFDYLIGIYKKPTPVGGWLKQEFVFPVHSLYSEGGILQFALSAPGIDKRHEVVKIKQLKFTLTKEPITWKNFIPKVSESLKNYFTKGNE